MIAALVIGAYLGIALIAVRPIAWWLYADFGSGGRGPDGADISLSLMAALFWPLVFSVYYLVKVLKAFVYAGKS